MLALDAFQEQHSRLPNIGYIKYVFTPPSVLYVLRSTVDNQHVWFYCAQMLPLSLYLVSIGVYKMLMFYSS